MLSKAIKSRGTALISAIFITALVAMLATAIAVQQRLLIHSASLVINHDQAYLDLQGVSQWSMAEITDYANQVSQSKAMIPPLNLTFPMQKFKGMTITGKIIDQQGLFNINNLSDVNQQSRFARLIQAVAPKINNQKAAALAQSVTNWLQKNSSDAVYLNLDSPYRAGHQPMAQVSELRAVQGFDATLYLALKPYIAAIPGQAGAAVAVNINSASAPVLMTLSSKLNIQQAKALVICRHQHGVFQTLDDFNNQCVKPLGLGELSNATVKSQYFVVKAKAQRDDQQLMVSTLLATQLDNKTNKIIVRSVSQAQG